MALQANESPQDGFIRDPDRRLIVVGVNGAPIGGGGGGGADIQYVEGDTTDPATGNTILWRKAGGGLVAVSATNPLPVNVVAGGGAGGLTDAQLRASAVPVSGTFFQATQPVSIAAPVAVTGTFWQATQPVSGPLTDVQLRASAVPVSGPLTDAQLRASAVPVSGPLTDAQLRASAVPVSGPLTDAQLRAVAVPVSGTFFQGTQPVSGPLTDAQLRAAAVPVDTEMAAASALTDGMAGGPTVPVLTANEMRFNGTTWDRKRGNFRNTTGDTGAKTVSFAGATVTNFDSLGAIITVRLAAVSGTTPTMACQLQWSPDAGTTWITLGPALGNLTATNQVGAILIGPARWNSGGGAGTALVTGANATLLLDALLPRTWRLNYTIGGTTPSFTITAVDVLYIGM